MDSPTSVVKTTAPVVITKIKSKGPQRVGLSKLFAGKLISNNEQESNDVGREPQNEDNDSDAGINGVGEESHPSEEKSPALGKELNELEEDSNDANSTDFQLDPDSSVGSESDGKPATISEDGNEPEIASDKGGEFSGFHENLTNQIKPVINVDDISKILVEVENQLLTEEINTDYSINCKFENSDKENKSSDLGKSTADRPRPASKRIQSESSDTSFDNVKGLTDSNNSNKGDEEGDDMEIDISNSSNLEQRGAKAFSTGSRHSGTESPATGGRRNGKRSSTLDLSNPAYRKPFEYGWKRELVYRNSNDTSSKIQADVYYYTPKNKKIRSNREVSEHLSGSDLTTDNFTFFKDSLGVDDPEKEIIRSAAQRTSIGGEVLLPIKKSPKVKEVKTPKESKIVKELKTPKVPKVEIREGLTISGPKAALGPRKGAFPRIKVTAVPSKPTLHKTLLSSKASKKSNNDGDMEMGMLPPSWSPSPNKSPSAKRKAETDNEASLPKRVKVEEEAIVERRFMQSFVSNVAEGYNALLQVFQYLKTQELLRAARVCRMWRDLAGHRSLWRTVRLKNSHVDDWQGLIDALSRHGTQNLDLRKMLLPNDVPENEQMWRDFGQGIARARTLTRIDLCRCPPFVVEDIAQACPQLITLNALTIKCQSINLTSLGNLKNLVELRLKSMTGTKLEKSLQPMKELVNLKYLAMTTFKEIGQAGCENFKYMTNLEVLELGECVDLPENFGEDVLMKLTNLQRLRLEKGQGKFCHTFRLLAAIKELPKLDQLELINFDVKLGFDAALAQCSNIKRLLLIPTYVTQSATTNYLILEGATKLKATLSHFVWGVTQELLRVTELFVDQCDSTGSKSPVKTSKKDAKVTESIPILKHGSLERMENLENLTKEELKDGKSQVGQVEIQTLHKLQKQLMAALPNTRIKIVKIPFQATWKQTIADPPHH